MEPVLPPLNLPQVKPADQSLTVFQQEYDRLANQLPLNPSINEGIPNYSSKSNPSQNPANAPVDLSQNFSDLLKGADTWAKDDYSYGKPFAFGAGERAMNFDRYYQHSGFKKLGFSPFRNNEQVYNDKTSIWADYGRAFPQILKLGAEGFKDLASEWTDWSGEPDTEMAAKMQQAMAIGNSSRGGVGGWINNFGINLGYTAGVLAEWAAEEVALTAVTAFTLGAASEVTIPTAIARTYKAFSNISDTYRSGKNLLKLAKEAKDVQQVSRLARLGNRAADFLNPFEHSTKFIKGFDQVEDYAKTIKGAAALFRDLKAINVVTSEAKLEGGTTKIDLTDDLVNLYYNEHGKLPEGEEVTKIQQQASKGAFMDILGNLPLIYGTNKIVFDHALAGISTKGGREVIADAAANKLNKFLSIERDWKAKGLKGPVQIGSIFSKAGFNSLMAPGHILKGTLRYTAANFAEGFQENLQDVMHDSVRDYYRQYYTDPTIASLRASFGHGFAGQASAQGLDTFFSGFLMGGVLQGIQKPLFTTLPTLAKKIFDPKGYETWKTEKETYVNNFVNAANDILKNPGKYASAFSNTDKNYVQQVLSKRMAERNGVKGSMDAKDESVFHNTLTMLRSGQFDIVSNYIKDLHNMSDTELSEAFGKDLEADGSGLDIRGRLNNFEKKTGEIKNLWDTVFKDLQNPVSLKDARTDKEAFDLYQDFEAYKELALFSNYSFNRSLDRINSIREKASASKVLSKASGAEFSVLYSPSDLTDQLRALRSEIKTLNSLDDRESKRELKSKTKRLETLSDYLEDLKNLQTVLNLKNLAAVDRSKANSKLKLEGNQAQVPFDDIIAEHNKMLFESYKKYVHTIADNQEPVLDSVLEDTFQGIKDYYELHQDRLDMGRAVNMIANPEFVTEFLTRVRAVRNEFTAQQVELYREGLEEFIKRSAHNELLNEIFKVGVYFTPEDTDRVIRGEPPTVFLDVTTNKPVTDQDKLNKVAAILKQYNDALNGPVETPVQPEIVKQEPTSEAGVTSVVQQRLQQAFDLENQARAANNEKPLAYTQWLKGATAQNIINPPAVVTPTPAPAVIAAPVITTDLNPVLPQFRGKIVFMTAGTGKSTFAEEHPEYVVDGDQLLFDFLKDKGIKHSTSQKSGLDFHKYLADHPKEELTLTGDFQNIAQGVAATGKTVLTASKYLRNIASELFLSSDVNRVSEIFRERGQSKEKAVEAAARHISDSQSLFKGRTIIPIQENQFAEHLLTGTVPEPVQIEIPESLQNRVDKIHDLSSLNTLEKQLTKEITKGNLTMAQVRQVVDNKRKDLISEIAYNIIHRGDIVLMKDKENYGKNNLAKVIRKSGDELLVMKWYPGMKGTGQGVTLTADQVADTIELKYKAVALDQDVTPEVQTGAEVVSDVNQEDLPQDTNPTGTPEDIEDNLSKEDDCI